MAADMRGAKEEPIEPEGAAIGRQDQSLDPPAWRDAHWNETPTAEQALASRELQYAPTSRTPVMNSLVSMAVITAALYFGRDLLVPLAFAILISFVLDPLVTWLKRVGVPRAAAVTLVVAATLGLIAATAFFAATQLRQIGNNLPTYETNITKKLRDFGRDLRKPGILDQYSRVFGKVEKEIGAVQASPGPRVAPPTQVELVTVGKPMARLMGWVETFVPTIASAGIVIVFVFLILLDRGDLRDRLLRLMGGNLHRATDALSEIGERVSKYLTMQLIVNATYGVPMTIGLLIIGVPGALVWGLLAALLRFVPYAGPLISAVFPLTLAFAIDPGWNMVLWTLALILVLELISNNIIEPWLYGSSTGLSTLSLILAALFWTALWGPMGLILSTPITVTLLVAGRYLPALNFLEVLLGSARALDEPTRLHQRLLAGDTEDAVELALDHAEKTSPEDFYTQVGLGTLQLATNAHGTVATAEHRHRVVSGMEEVIEELREQYPPEPGQPVKVACIGGRWAVDALAAEMAAHVLALKGYGSRVLQVGNVSAEHFAQLDLEGISVVCLCYFSPSPTTHARFFVRRLKRRWPHTQIILAAWNHLPDPREPNPVKQIGADALVTSLDELVVQAGSLLDHTEPYVPAPLPEKEQERLQALHASGLLQEGMRARLDTYARHAAEAFDCTIAQVSLVDEQWQLVHGYAGSDGPLIGVSPERAAPRDQALCSHVVALGQTLVVPDVQRDARFAGNQLLRERGIRFYAGAPLRDADGMILGTLCLLDTKPRALTPRDILLLESMAAELMAIIKRSEAAVEQAPPDMGLAPGAA